MQEVKWGEFKIGDLFDINRGNISNQKELIHDSKGICFIAQNNNNNGFVDTVKPQNHKIFKGNSLIIGRQTGIVYYQEKDFITTDGVLVLTAKENFIENKNTGLVFVSALNKKMLSFGYNNTVSEAKLNKIKIKLPIKNDTIDFNFMENFIAELEAERIAELEAYLSVTGLKDYTLTKEEQQALDDFEKLKFRKFNVIDIFDVKNTGNILSRDIVENSGKTPYLCASITNNAVSSYISYDEKYLDKGNCIFIGGKTFTVTYQEKDFYSNDSHNLALYLKKEEKNKSNYLYLATCINKSLKHKYSWGDSISNKKIQIDKIFLPVNNYQPYYDAMETFISAIQKLVIRDVILYADKKIAATKTIVNKNN
ncbi:restriction endonuclease subunit S [Apibacter mensalis]|nr:restriction endonuclease subunit S [Apibacter mensalis]